MHPATRHFPNCVAAGLIAWPDDSELAAARQKYIEAACSADGETDYWLVAGTDEFIDTTAAAYWAELPKGPR